MIEEIRKQIEDDYARAVRHTAQRYNVPQDEVESIFKSLKV